jgi:two-component system, LytTR family, response regulator
MVCDARAPRLLLPDSRVRTVLVMGVLPWVALTLLVTLQGQAFAALQGHPQAFWPALAYTAAIYSVWALLGPAFLAVAGRIVAAKVSPAVRGAKLAFGLPAVLLLHVGLFSVLYWPIYGRGMASPLEMMPYVLGANLDTGTLAYAAIVALAVLRRRSNRDAAGEPNGYDAPRPVSPAEGLWVRAGGQRQHVALEAIEWLGAAGDYVEVHMDGRTVLADSSLAALDTALPRADFARVHRTAIVRLDKVRAVRAVGRGDALLELSSGATVRLSRRYRQGLSGWAALG